MQELDKFKGQEGKKYFQDQIGHGSDYSLSEVLWVCANLFSDVQFKMSHKRIMLFTNEDDPHGNDSAQASRARTKAGDLRDTGRYSHSVFVFFLTALLQLSFIQQTKDSTPSPQRRGPQSLINLFDHTVWLVGILVSQPEIELMPPAMEA